LEGEEKKERPTSKRKNSLSYAADRTSDDGEEQARSGASKKDSERKPDFYALPVRGPNGRREKIVLGRKFKCG